MSAELSSSCSPKRLASAISLALTGTAFSAGATPQFVITDLGTLGGDTSIAFGLNDAGQVVGQATIGNARNIRHAFLYQNGTMTDLFPDRMVDSSAHDINNLGQVVGEEDTIGFIRDSSGTLVRITSPFGDNTAAQAINDVGQVVGPSGSLNHAFLYQNGVMTDLFPGGLFSSAHDINSHGQVVGETNLIGYIRERDGTVVPIINTIGGSTSTAWAINDRGQVVGVASDGSFQHAFLYQNGVMTDLFPGELGNSTAYDINAIGQIVGSQTGAFIAWRDASGNIAFTSLDGRLDSTSQGWNLSDARAVNAFGQIVGVGINPSGQSHAFLATPTGTLSWTTGSGDWDDPVNWELGFLPNKFLDPIVAASQTDINVKGPAADATVRNLTVGGGTDAATLNLDTASRLTINGEFLINGPNGGDRVVQSAGTISAQSVTIGQSGHQGAYTLSGDGSRLTAAGESIGRGGVGRFTQTGGTHTVSNTLAIGSSAAGFDADGTYLLQEGTLAVTNEVLADGTGGTGTFTQTGGTHTVTETLTIGRSGGQGAYTLSGDGSRLTAASESIGRGGVGRFTQTGGTHTVSNTLAIGSSAAGFDADGTYVLEGGILDVTNEIVGDGRTGGFAQTGGAHVVRNQLTVGLGATGSYDLSGSGNLVTAVETIGHFGTGTFNQTEGTHEVTETLNIGKGRGDVSGGSGTFTLRDGILTAGNENIGLDGADGTVTQSGGTHTVTGTMTISATGTYVLSGGSLNLANASNEGRIVQSGGTISGTSQSGTALTNQGTYEYFGGTYSGSLINGGTAVFNPRENAVFDANISGSGSLNKGGLATLILAGANTYSGGTIVTQGALEGNTSSLQGDIINNAVVVFDQTVTGTYAGTMSGQGGLTKRGTGTLLLVGANTYSGGTTVNQGVLQGNTTSLQGDMLNNATVVFDQANTGIYSGSIGGEGQVVKENSGLLVFNSANTYRGGTLVNNGNLQVGDAAHPDASLFGLVNIGPNGALSGHGTIDGDVDSAGRIAPGGSIGTLTVNGNVTFQNGSTFQTAIDPNQSSLLQVNGLATLGDAQVEVLADNGRYGPNRYTILSAASISGRFLDRIDSNLASIDPLLTPSLAYDSNNVYLDLNPVPLQDPMGAGTRVATNLIYMINRMATGRLNAPLGEACPPASLGFWGRGLGMFSSVDASRDSPGYSADTAGFVMGVDGQWTERLALGISGFSAHSDVTTNSRYSNRSTVNTAAVSVYGAYTTGAWQLKSVLGYANETYTSQQAITAAQPRRAQGSTAGNRISNYTEGSYTFRSGVLSLQPLLALQLGWMQQDPFTQKGLFADGQGLSVSGRTLYELDTLVGARARQDFPVDEGVKLQVEFRALYLHQFGTLQNTVSGQLSGGQLVSLGTADRPGERDAGIVGGGLALLAAENVNFYFDYSAQVQSSQTAHFFSGGIRYAW